MSVRNVCMMIAGWGLVSCIGDLENADLCQSETELASEAEAGNPCRLFAAAKLHLAHRNHPAIRASSP